jgi:hypothetical protein
MYRHFCGAGGQMPVTATVERIFTDGEISFEIMDYAKTREFLIP